MLLAAFGGRYPSVPLRDGADVIEVVLELTDRTRSDRIALGCQDPNHDPLPSSISTHQPGPLVQVVGVDVERPSRTDVERPSWTDVERPSRTDVERPSRTGHIFDCAAARFWGDRPCMWACAANGQNMWMEMGM